MDKSTVDLRLAKIERAEDSIIIDEMERAFAQQEREQKRRDRAQVRRRDFKAYATTMVGMLLVVLQMYVATNFAQRDWHVLAIALLALSLMTLMASVVVADRVSKSS